MDQWPATNGPTDPVPNRVDSQYRMELKFNVNFQNSLHRMQVDGLIAIWLTWLFDESAIGIPHGSLDECDGPEMDAAPNDISSKSIKWLCCCCCGC